MCSIYRRLNARLSDMAKASFAYVKEEFAVTLGYVRQDIRWLLDRNSGLNYTIGLLIGCGCEMLAACDGDPKRLGEKVFADLLPTGDWQLLADRLYSALRDGLAHGFDTKHLFVDGKEHQIFLRSDAYAGLTVIGDGLLIGLRPIAEALCAKIDNYESLLAHDAEARKRFVGARQKKAILNAIEADAWRRLVKAAGIR
jgi:hypothetical protein